MPFAPPGKYDHVCKAVREQLEADGLVLIVINGTEGHGLSVQVAQDILLTLPEVLETIAQGIRASLTSGPVQ